MNVERFNVIKSSIHTYLLQLVIDINENGLDKEFAYNKAKSKLRMFTLTSKEYEELHRYLCNVLKYREEVAH